MAGHHNDVLDVRSISRPAEWKTNADHHLINSSILTGLPAGAYGAASTQMSQEWNIDETNFPYLSFALVTWNMGAAIFPLLFVPLTENTGRLPGYFGAYVLFCIWLIPSALSPNFATILVTRFFGGGASSVAINLVGESLFFPSFVAKMEVIANK